ncbi:hypothetical protein [Catelliglobosispora koreensis]|uniref:hypothetical protein n=1 Tax=Catelliglobosispora koreensis TaxID=129052 RepID=UPI000375B349|nr:hypothetical protein [Catelliglobosispora koreensis]
MSYTEDDLLVTDPQWPNWRAKLICDDQAEQPWGDGSCPALLIERGDAWFAKGVFQPAYADRILQARRHFGDDQLLERYLRMLHGTTTVVHVTSRDLDVMLFDTSGFRDYIGVSGPANLAAEQQEWRFWLDGEVFGISVEHNPLTIAKPAWVEWDAIWGFYGLAYSRERAKELLTENITAAVAKWRRDGGR